MHNVNADTAAAVLAIAMQAARLVVLTDVAGLYRDYPANTDIITSIDTFGLAGMLPTLTSGMIPKMGAALRAVTGGCPVHRSSTGGFRTPCSWSCSPTRAWERW